VIELHTGRYADALPQRPCELAKIAAAAQTRQDRGLYVNRGMGSTRQRCSLSHATSDPRAQYRARHLARAIFVGLPQGGARDESW